MPIRLNVEQFYPVLSQPVGVKNQNTIGEMSCKTGHLVEITRLYWPKVVQLSVQSILLTPENRADDGARTHEWWNHNPLP